MPPVGSVAMALKGLRWNRSEKDLSNRRSTLDPSNHVRHSEQVQRSDATSDWESDQSKRANSMDDRPVQAQASAQPMTTVAEGGAERQIAQEPRPSTARLSRLRFIRQHASDTQLATRAKQLASEQVPPLPVVPPTPAIITTAPTLDIDPNPPTLQRQRSRLLLFNRQKQPENPAVSETQEILHAETKQKSDNRKSKFGAFRSGRAGPLDDLRKLAGDGIEAHSRLSTEQGDGSAISTPLPRQSLSARSDIGPTTYGDDQNSSEPTHRLFQTGRPGRAFTWFPRKPRTRASLFPLSDRENSQHPHTAPATVHGTPRPSTSALVPGSPEAYHRSNQARRELRAAMDALNDSTPAAAVATSAAASLSFATPGTLLRHSSSTSHGSIQSSSALAPPTTLGKRDRSSTMGSASEQSDDPPPTPPFVNGGSGRTSTSTAGRSSLSNMFSLSNRFRNSDPQSPRQGSVGTNGLSTATTGLASHTTSLNLPREVPLPDRGEGETAMRYLERVEDLAHRSQIPSILSKSGDDFRHAVLRSFMRKFAYFGDPLDMAIRKLLMEVDLPKETQQIDRVLQSFADRYHECNAGIFASADKAYIISFSILMLQTDIFNKNNKRKMTKPDYVKNSSIEGVSCDVLECFYDNTVYTPFIRVEDDQDILTMRMRKTNRKTAKAARAAKAAIRNVPTDPIKRASREPLDPYTLIFESKLDTLRPPLKEAITIEDPFSYLGTSPEFDMKVLRNSKAGIVQIESARSRPNAFSSDSGRRNPDEATAGIVDLPVDKVGILWRKDPKKKKTRSPWQEWGAILTGAGLYFFKNAGWVRSYIHQYEQHLKHGNGGSLCFFNPPVTSFKPEQILPTDHAVALQDTTYRKHKNAFLFFRHNGSEELFLADNEMEMNDWLAKLNAQAAFKTAGIRQRGLLGGHYDGQRHRGLRRNETSGAQPNMKTVQTATGEVTIQSGKIDRELAQQISAARREKIEGKIQEAEEKLVSESNHLKNLIRDAQHLLVLAPIQQKTREQLVSAAGRVQAQLKWARIEVWRTKCHKEILSMDLEEERKEAQRRQAQIEKFSSPPSGGRPDGVQRLNSATSHGTARASLRRAHSPAQEPRPTTKSSQDTAIHSITTTAEDDDRFHTPPERASPEHTPPRTPTSGVSSAVAATSVDVSSSPKVLQTRSPVLHIPNRLSIISNASSASRLQPAAPRSSYDENLASPTGSDYVTPTVDDDEAERRREAQGPSVVSGDENVARPQTPVTPTSARQEDVEDPLASPHTFGGNVDRNRKVRRSLHRTLREHSETRLQHRSASRKHAAGSKDLKETSSSAVIDGSLGLSSTTSSSQGIPGGREKGDRLDGKGLPAGLTREKGSFTVHGKKASVVTFGGDWTATAEETLQRMKAAAKPSDVSSETGMDNDDTSITIGSAPIMNRSTTNDVVDERPEDGLPKEPSSNASTTPTPGSPSTNASEFKRPPRKSSLSNRDRGGISARNDSSAGFPARSTDIVSVDDETVGKEKIEKARETSVEA